MNMKFSHILLCFTTLFFVSCSDLEETVYSETVESTFYKSKEEIIGAYTRPWAHTQWVLPHSIWHLSELSADAAAWTTKTTGDGFDGGNWISLHNHSYTPSLPELAPAWGDLWKGVGFINGVLEGIEDVSFETLDMPITKAEMTAELRALRAYYYYLACDLWGNVPIVTKVADPSFPSTNTRAEVFQFIETELIEALPDLPAKKHAETYGYFTKSGANALLAKLYLNAEVFAGEEQYQKCLDACQKVIDSGNYSLDDNWQDPFLPNNELSKENIFAFALDGVGSFAYSISVKTLHYSHQQAFGLSFGPWNGIVTQEAFYDSYHNDDLRKQQYLVGPQYIKGTNTPVKAVKEFAGEDLIIVKGITAMNGAFENEGVRNYKYQLEEGVQAHNPKNDYVILRYTDVLMTKAEALMRLNGGAATAEAVSLVNEIRERAFGANFSAHQYTTGTLTLDELLAERGREFAYEGQRRTDLIRFGKFNNAWWEKQASQTHKNIYPIPLSQIQTNPNLKQNEGY